MKEKLKQLPQSPGVYMMYDSLGNIIYVGKAKNLKSRVSQYFYDQRDRDPKVADMIKHIHSFHYQITDTELDAFIEECRLIKELKPRYNSQMKNNKKYIYLRNADEQYPRVTVTNEILDSGSYYGPFTSPQGVENVIRHLNDFYPLRKCLTPKLVKRHNGCLFMQLGSCLGVCTGQVKTEEYWTYIEKIQQLLNGKDQSAIRNLVKKIDIAIENLKFEKASEYREYYKGLRHVINKQRLVNQSSKNRNILAVELMGRSQAKLFFIKGNRLLSGKVISTQIDKTEMKQAFLQIIRKGYLTTELQEDYKLTERDIDEAQIIFSYLKKNRKQVLTFSIPVAKLKSEKALETSVQKIIDQITQRIN
ncbi:GIY-YIG nuclease family protein [Desulfosporosinus hippei]|uniref:Excinuclease ABC subunit C n=1 Tax=Desulfosporosinus hippei DSM 8344 TaxID=1121419 RepID=A0A1G7WJK9_9FIRM|nr:GIY-YIG nuclease family protein [Desulfosporosinus hippei]SDG72009.1 excinuclease ABC subunit C [Desulfosporosinus hippei DSM 8344]